MSRLSVVRIGASMQSRERATAFLLVAPAISLLLVFFAWPAAQAVLLSFTRWNGISEPTWIGIENYAYMLSDDTFWTALLNNLRILLALPIWVLLPFLIASALHAGARGARPLRLAFFFPAVLSAVVIGVYWNILLRADGALNDALRVLGLESLAQPWLAQSTTALPALIAIIVWSTFGIGVVIFVAALGTIDQEQLDAAELDGANWWRLQRHIVIPAIRPVVEFWTVIIVITSFTAVFPLIFSLTGGGPGFATYVLEYLVYREAFANGSLGYASAIGVALFVVIAAVFGAGWVVRRVMSRVG